VIHIGDHLSVDRRAWLVCHEIAHAVLTSHRPNSSYGLDPEVLRRCPLELRRFQRQEREAEALASLLVHNLEGLLESASQRMSRERLDEDATCRGAVRSPRDEQAGPRAEPGRQEVAGHEGSVAAAGELYGESIRTDDIRL
jgi:hypothetical protein